MPRSTYNCSFPFERISLNLLFVSGPCYKVSFKIERVYGETIDDNDGGEFYFLFGDNMSMFQSSGDID